MLKFLRHSLIAATLLVSIGCSNLEFPGVYRLAIEQGNVVTQDMVDQLKPGMSREQVEFVMGSPLIRDPFNDDRWDYLYRIEHGDKTVENYRMSIFFEADRLKSFTGDFLPGTAANGDNAGGPDAATPNTPAPDAG